MGSSFASLRWQRRQTEDLLKRFQFFEPGGFSCRNVVTIGGAVGFADDRLGRNDTDRRTAGDAFGAQERRNRSFVIGLGHGELSVWVCNEALIPGIG